MPSMVRDDSIGQALGALASGFNGPSPKSQFEAMLLKERILSAQAERANNALKAKELQNQQDAQAGLLGEFDKMLTPQALGVQPIVEAPLPTPEFNGPMPAMANPQMVGLDQRIGFARAAAKNAIMRGGGPGDALGAAYAALGQARVFAGGVPTDPATAAQTQTMLTNKLPDKNTPLTEQERVRMAQEKQAAELAGKSFTVPQEGTLLLSPELGKHFNVPANAQGQHAVSAPQQGPFRGSGMDAQAQNIVDAYNRKKAAGVPLTADDERTYNAAFYHLYGPKEELKPGPNGGTVGVTLRPYVPPGIYDPIAATNPTQTTMPPPAAPVSAPPVSAPPATNSVIPPAGPVSGAVSAPGVSPAVAASVNAGPAPMVRQVIPGKQEPNPEHVKRSLTFIQNMDGALAKMNQMFDAGFKPSFLGEVLGPNARPGGGSMQNQIQSTLMNLGQGKLAPQDQVYMTQALKFLNAVLRDESGAAVPESEYPRYIASLIPSYGDGPEQIAAKRENMALAVQARKNGVMLKDIHAIIAPGQPFVAVAADGSPIGGAPTATGAAPAQAAPAPASEPPRRKIRVNNGKLEPVP